MGKEKVYLVCDKKSGNWNLPAVNMERMFLGRCEGRVVAESGLQLHGIRSSTIGWLEKDLRSLLLDEDMYEVVNLLSLSEKVPERLKL